MGVVELADGFAPLAFELPAIVLSLLCGVLGLLALGLAVAVAPD